MDKGTTTWALIDKQSPYFNPSEKEFMINYQVENPDELVKELNAAGIRMLDKIESYSYGKFVHLLDPGGNKIEPWESIGSWQFTERR